MGSRPVHRTDDVIAEIDKHLPDLYHHREDEKDYHEQAQTEQAQILALYERLGIKSHVTQVPGGVITGTFSQSTSSYLDEAMLRTRIGATEFNKLTSRVLDSAKLKDAIAKGQLDPAIVSACTRTTKNNPSIRTSYTAKTDKKNKSE